MKICIVGPSLKMGGIERASSNIANQIAMTGYNVTFLALFPQERFFNLNPAIQFDEPKGKLNKDKLSISKSVLWLRNRLKKANPDRILAFNYFYGAITRLAISGFSVPLYVSDRMSPKYQWPKSVIIFNSIIYCLLPPSGIICQTELAADLKKRFFGNRTRITVIPNALRGVQLFPEITRRKQILAVGRLNDYLKGFDRLIEAFAKIKDKEWILIFAGGDEEGEELKGQARKLGVLDRIRFLGKVKEIDEVFAQAGIFVITSRSEGFPNALCEAMAAGLPCISFDFIAGPRDIITDDYNGILVENGNIELLAEEMDFLIEHELERKRLGQNALQIRNMLDADKIVKKYLDFIVKQE
jgi:GalNAc-alpha-(1->4)-GalNAc-alpha-(1->3)-diNAcBac-PP-undecaprenol alpha-1,4-N-acetyl-D-galactosaminyltransferase